MSSSISNNNNNNNNASSPASFDPPPSEGLPSDAALVLASASSAPAAVAVAAGAAAAAPEMLSEGAGSAEPPSVSSTAADCGGAAGSAGNNNHADNSQRSLGNFGVIRVPSSSAGNITPHYSASNASALLLAATAGSGSNSTSPRAAVGDDQDILRRQQQFQQQQLQQSALSSSGISNCGVDNIGTAGGDACGRSMPKIQPLHIAYSSKSVARSQKSSAAGTSGKAEPLLRNQQGDIIGGNIPTDDDPCCNKENFGCCYEWLAECVWPGMGLFGESYLLFSIGTLKPLWEILYPSCFLEGECSDRLLHSLSYSVVLGVIVGMLGIGYMAKNLGRRRGSITTAALMSGAACGLAFTSAVLARVRNGDDEELSNPVALFRCMSVLLFVFGMGVGGEYPLAASSASEKAMGEMKQSFKRELEREDNEFQADGLIVIDEQPEETSSENQQQEGEDSCPTGEASSKQDPGNSTGSAAAPSPSAGVAPQLSKAQTDFAQERYRRQPEAQQHRGRKIQLVFTMQGAGIFFNSLTMSALILITGQTGKQNVDEYDVEALLAIWRITYGVGAVVLFFVLISRIKYLAESAVWLDDKRRREQLARNSIAPALSHNTTAAEASNNYINNSLQYPPSSQLQQLEQQQQQQQQQNYTGHNPLIRYSFPQVSQSPSGLSCVSSVSSLSAPSVAINPEDMMTIKEVPSTDPEEDIKTSTMSLLLRNYGIRLLGVSLAWMLWDVAFYGNKLFQSSFLLTLTGEDTTLLEFALAATLNSAVALMGYFGAAAIIDHPMVGRCRLQQVGFLLTGLLFVGCGFLYNDLSPTILVAMYLGSSFFGQLGPNATTFLLPAEIFPTEMRTLCHGIAAASGKVGALMAAVMFNHVKDLDMFLLSGYASFAACAITFWTIPETSGLDLYEVDRKWRMILDGRKAEYEGEANSSKYLSYYERNKLILNQQSKNSHHHHVDAYDVMY